MPVAGRSQLGSIDGWLCVSVAGELARVVGVGVAAMGAALEAEARLARLATGEAAVDAEVATSSR